jgi:hypothetical protein
VTKADMKRGTFSMDINVRERSPSDLRSAVRQPLEEQPDSAPRAQSDDTPKTMEWTMDQYVCYVLSRMGDLKEIPSRAQ